MAAGNVSQRPCGIFWVARAVQNMKMARSWRAVFVRPFALSARCNRHSPIGREIVAKRRAADANWRKTTPRYCRAAAHNGGVQRPSLLGVRVLRCRNRASPRAAARVARPTGVSYLRKRLS
jgi:hypothetical protein